MTVNTNDIVKIVLDYLYPGAGTALNIFHYVFAGDSQADEDVMDALESFFNTNWGSLWDDMAPTNAILNDMKGQIVSGTGEVLRDLGTRNLNHPGTNGIEVNPAAVSVYLQGQTTTPQVYGRKYIPGISESFISDGVLDAAALVVAGLLLIEYLDSVNVAPGANLFPGVISKRELGFRAFADSGLIRGIPAYQRRRKEGVGI